jgi:hypothetical protein
MQIRKLATVALCGGYLTACANTATLNTNIATAIAEVQAATDAVCLVVPTAASIAALIAVGDPTLTTASAIAGIICKAVAASAPASLSTRRRGELLGTTIPRPVAVDGVTVTFQ